MVFKVNPDRWLAVEAERVKAIVMLPKYWGCTWTPETLQKALGDIGLDYSISDIKAVQVELDRQGVVVDVQEKA